jgi:hypothetical protein
MVVAPFSAAVRIFLLALLWPLLFWFSKTIALIPTSQVKAEVVSS